MARGRRPILPRSPLDVPIPPGAALPLAEHQPAAAEHQDAAITVRFDRIDETLAELRKLLEHLEQRSRFLG